MPLRFLGAGGAPGDFAREAACERVFRNPKAVSAGSAACSQLRLYPPRVVQLNVEGRMYEAVSPVVYGLLQVFSRQSDTQCSFLGYLKSRSLMECRTPAYSCGVRKLALHAGS